MAGDVIKTFNGTDIQTSASLIAEMAKLELHAVVEFERAPSLSDRTNAMIPSDRIAQSQFFGVLTLLAANKARDIVIHNPQHDRDKEDQDVRDGDARHRHHHHYPF